MASATDLITQALRTLGIVEATETIQAEDASNGLTVLNQMIGSWNLSRTTAKFVARTTLALSTDTDAYAFSIFVGNHIEAVSVIPDRAADPPNEVPLGRPLTVTEWQGISDKTLSGTYPSRIYIDESEGTAINTVHVYPVPNQDASDLILYCPTPVSQFAALATDYTFPPGYERAIRLNLVLELAPDYDVEPSAHVVLLARQALDTLKAHNLPMRDLWVDPALVTHGRSSYNINTDSS